MRRILLRASVRAALSWVAGVALWVLFGAVVLPLLTGNIPAQQLARYFAALPGIALYVGLFAAVAGLFLLLPFFAAYAVHEWLRVRTHAGDLSRSQAFLVSGVFAVPPALAVAYSFAYRFNFFDIDWRDFWQILPIAAATFWGAAVFPYWVLPSLRQPLATAAEQDVAGDVRPGIVPE